MKSAERQKIKHLIADTTAFINAVPLNEYSENVYTVPEVLAEVRNKRQIRRLCVLPFDLKVVEPRPENVKHCVEFAKKTGDYGSLSGIDLKVIALTYEMEIDIVGAAHLRAEPVTSTTICAKETPELQTMTSLAGWYNPNNQNQNGSPCNDEANEDKHLENLNSDLTNDDLNTMHTMFENLICDASSGESLEVVVSESLEFDAECNENADDDSDTWITPSNIIEVKKSLEGSVEDDKTPVVACITTDYALQNVLKQMNLQITALDGRVIKQLRTYILRCYACFKTTSIMTKVFCPNCGNKTLKRVSVSLDENGKQSVFINTKRPLTSKFKNQSLPRFRGGKHSRNPILFEDQPMPRQMPSRVAKTKTNALHEDYVAGMSPFVMRDVESKSAILRSKGNLKEWARNNNFEEDRRRKHYNRLYK